MAPHRRPLARARRWDGIVPIGSTEELDPGQLAAYLALDGGSPPRGWDVVAHRRAGVPAREYADAGATWLVTSPWPLGEWEVGLDDVVRRGPQRD